MEKKIKKTSYLLVFYLFFFGFLYILSYSLCNVFFHMFQEFVKKNKKMFVFFPADRVFLHDKVLARSILRIFPTSITPNKVTATRILLTPFVFYFLLSDFYTLGIVFFLIAACTDMIDGSLARTRNQITKFGMLFDPLADKLLIGGVVLLIVFGNFHFLFGILILVLEVLFIVAACVAKVRFNTVRAANIWGKIKMISQVFAVFFTLLALGLDIPFFLIIATWLFGFAIAFAVVSLFFQGV